MGLVVNTNIAALNSYRNLSVTDGQMNKSLEKLSSGFRINRAADDAAGLAISEGLRSQIGGLKVAVRNTQDGISVVQTAEGALTETHSILQRMRDLSVQASNSGGLNDDAKGNIQSEIGQLKSRARPHRQHHHLQRQEAARRQLHRQLPGGRQRRRDHRGQRRHGDGLQRSGRQRRRCHQPPAPTPSPRPPATTRDVGRRPPPRRHGRRRSRRGDRVHRGARSSSLTGTISFGGKSLRPRFSVDYASRRTRRPPPSAHRAEHGGEVRSRPDHRPVRQRP